MRLQLQLSTRLGIAVCVRESLAITALVSQISKTILVNVTPRLIGRLSRGSACNASSGVEKTGGLVMIGNGHHRLEYFVVLVIVVSDFDVHFLGHY